MTKDEVESDYETNTGKVIIEAIDGTDVMATPGILVRNHGPFVWGKDPANAVYNATVMEHVAEMAYNTMVLDPRAQRVPQYLLDKHYNRKHGANAYYGQDNR